MTDIFQEVEEEYRTERLVTTIRRRWPYAAGALALLLAGVYGAQQWSTQSAAARQVFSDRFVEAQNLVSTQQWDKAETALNGLLKSAPEGYIAPIHMERAAVFLGEQDSAKAIQALESAAATAKDPLLADLARLKASYVALASEEAGTALRARLEPLIQRGGGLGLMAREIAGLLALKTRDLKTAREQFEYISLQVDGPPNLRQRAQTMVALINQQEAATTPAAPQPGAAPAAEASGAAAP